MSETGDDYERFGVSIELMRKVREHHRGIIRLGCYVPTRTEVSTGDPAALEVVLHDWWWESPTELIPTDDQVKQVLDLLRARPDAASPTIQRIIALADDPDST